MNTEILYHARVIQDIQLKLEKQGEFTIRLGTEESAAILAGIQLLPEDHMERSGNLTIMTLLVNNGCYIAKRSHIHLYDKIKKLLCEKGYKE